MSSTASSVAVAMEIIAALGKLYINLWLLEGHVLSVHTDLFYNVKLNAAVAIFQIFATQMIGYGVAGARKCEISSIQITNSSFCSPHPAGLPYIVCDPTTSLL